MYIAGLITGFSGNWLVSKKNTCKPRLLFLLGEVLRPERRRGLRGNEDHAGRLHSFPQAEAFSSSSPVGPRAPLLAMQLIRPTVWGPGLVTSLKDAGSTQPLSGV